MTEKHAAVTETQNADGSTTLSMKLSEMSIDQLEQVSQALGRQRDSIRDQMLHVRKLIDARVAEQNDAALRAQIAALQGQLSGTAPGAVIEASAQA